MKREPSEQRREAMASAARRATDLGRHAHPAAVLLMAWVAGRKRDSALFTQIGRAGSQLLKQHGKPTPRQVELAFEKIMERQRDAKPRHRAEAAAAAEQAPGDQGNKTPGRSSA